MEENSVATELINPRPSATKKGPDRSESRFHGAVVVFLGLLSFFLLVGLIRLGVHYHNSVHCSTGQFCNIESNLTEYLQTSENKISSLTKERNQLNSRLASVEANLTKCLQNSENKISSLTRERNQLNSRLASVEADLTKRLQNSENEISSLTRERDQLNSRLASVEADLTKRLQNSENKISSLTRERNQLNSRLASVEADLTKRLQNSENKISSLTRERDLLNAKLTENSRSCPEGWRMFLFSCYFLSTKSGSWCEGRQDCNNMNADLVVINSPEKQEFVSKITTESADAWIGLTDRDQENTWKWINQDPLSVGYWEPGEPNNSGHPQTEEEDCIQIKIQRNKLQNWNDINCGRRLRWICEKDL